MDPVSLALTFGPALLRGAANLFGGEKEKQIIGKVADIVDTAKGSPQEAKAQLASLPREELIIFEKFMATHKKNMRELDAKIIESVNKTMRVESQSADWWVSGWRPFWGFVSAFAFLAVCITVLFLAYQAVAKGNSAAITMIPQLITAFSMLFATPLAVLGITAHGRNKLKVKEAEHRHTSKLKGI